MISLLLEGSKRLCVDRTIQHQGSTNSVGIWLSDGSMEHDMEQIPKNRSSALDRGGISDTCSIDTGHADDQSKVLQKKSVSLMNLKTRSSRK